MATIFSRIAKGEISSYKVAEDERFFAFLDISPLVEGHVLVIPKEETDYLFDLGSKDYADLFLFAKKVATAIKSVVPCKRIGVAVIGLEVPHAHIHLVPLKTMDDINFSREKLKLSAEKMQAIASAINQAFSELPD
jgi:histidine triad (HIT) family protein